VENNVLTIAILAYFLQIMPQLKTFSKHLSAHIILILDATFVPTLTFLGLLGPEISFREKTVTYQHRYEDTQLISHL